MGIKVHKYQVLIVKSNILQIVIMINNDEFKQPWQVTAKQTLVNVFNVAGRTGWPKASRYICSRETKHSWLS